MTKAILFLSNELESEIPKGPAMHSSPVPLAFQDTEWEEEAEAKPLWVLKTVGRMGVTSVHPASPATLPTNPPEARSSPCLNPPQPLCPLRSTTELGSILEPGYLGSSGQWDMMRPQKGSISGDLSSGSSKYQLHSKPTVPAHRVGIKEAALAVLSPSKHILHSPHPGPRGGAGQSRSETCCTEQRKALDHGEVGDEPVASPQDPAALPVNGHRRPGPAAKGRSDRSTATHCRVTLGLESNVDISPLALKIFWSFSVTRI
ncbi:hypothetical protein MJG53_001627 [Ovis ammon polii x Ovis aries]|uniref:Uncharacterized protein n=1 Tax=Ovis ammon polii x Ovis aries TaxID=2918886 RepID=A0ACB9VLE2_9CETA|nr:hypothetical protein MJG53_001627 [Ovis ammon polii x Ovis aries]